MTVRYKAMCQPVSTVRRGENVGHRPSRCRDAGHCHELTARLSRSNDMYIVSSQVLEQNLRSSYTTALRSNWQAINSALDDMSLLPAALRTPLQCTASNDSLAAYCLSRCARAS